MKKLPASCIRFKNIWAVKFPNWVNGIQRQRRSGRAGRRCCCVTSGNVPWSVYQKQTGGCRWVTRFHGRNMRRSTTMKTLSFPFSQPGSPSVATRSSQVKRQADDRKDKSARKVRRVRGRHARTPHRWYDAFVSLYRSGEISVPRHFRHFRDGRIVKLSINYYVAITTVPE